MMRRPFDEARLLFALVGVVALLLLGTIGFAVVIFERVNRNETVTCDNQARGLPIGHDLQRVVEDIDLLLQSYKGAGLPPGASRILTDMRANAARYASAEAAQPHRRSC